MNIYARNFADALEDRDVKYFTDTTDDGDDVLILPFEDYDILFFFGGKDGEMVKIIAKYKADIPEEKTNDMILLCNSLNNEYNIERFYLTEENNLIIDSVAFVDEDGVVDELMTLLSIRCNVLADVKKYIMKTIWC